MLGLTEKIYLYYFQNFKTVNFNGDIIVNVAIGILIFSSVYITYEYWCFYKRRIRNKICTKNTKKGNKIFNKY